MMTSTQIEPPPSRLDRLLVAADFHLTGSESARFMFAELLNQARYRDAPLFILGDLFHYWFGRRHLELDMYTEELSLLREAHDSGVRIYLLPGNRDFLLDGEFSRRTGVWVGGDALKFRLGEERVHFSHGDLFCTSDLNYQAMRRLIRSAPMRFLANRLPAVVVDRIAGRLRRHSERVVKEKHPMILEPDRVELLSLFAEGHEVVVCGHFHRFRDQSFEAGRFIVLEPFENRGAYLSATTDGGWTRELSAP